MPAAPIVAIAPPSGRRRRTALARVVTVAGVLAVGAVACGGPGDGSALPPTTVFETAPPPALGSDPSLLQEITTTTSPEDVAALADALAAAAAASPVTPTPGKGGKVAAPSGPRTATVGSPAAPKSGAAPGSPGGSGATPTTAGGAPSYRATLGPGDVTPPPGDPGASGTANVVADRAGGQLCYELSVRGFVGEPTEAHLHRAPRGATGDTVATFAVPAGDGSTKGCVRAAAALLAEIERDPATFAVDAHSRTHPGGAVRGQLAKA